MNVLSLADFTLSRLFYFVEVPLIAKKLGERQGI